MRHPSLRYCFDGCLIYIHHAIYHYENYFYDFLDYVNIYISFLTELNDMASNAFVALDFETANYKRTIICSVGMVKVIDNQLTETFYTLVNPKDYFSPQNIRIHGIHQSDVQDAPDFAYVYPYTLQFIDNLPVVAHNAAFDMSVLHASIQAANIQTPPMTYFCSYQLSKRTVASKRHGLKHMMSHFKLNFHGHHDALNDAKACAMITYRLLKHYPSLENVLQIYGKQLTDKDSL